VPETGRCHLYELLTESERVGKELTKDFYLGYAKMRQAAFQQLCRDNPDVPRHKVLGCAQKLLDRVLFAAFCEDRGLLPTETIRKAYEHRDPYRPHLIWENFRGLFQAINQGNAALGIHAYNGGLFADDPLLDRLTVSDEVCKHFRELGDYDYRPAHQATFAPAAGNQSLIDVDILGHIFEQSITDLEKLRNELEGTTLPSPGTDRRLVGRGAGGEGSADRSAPRAGGEGSGDGSADGEGGNGEPAPRSATRRKKEGAFYTPSFVTRYIIEQALGAVLRERFEQLRQSHQNAAKGLARTALAEPSVYELDKLKKPQRAALVRFWEAWQDELKTIRLLDPACGSGAFLIEAFDQLHATYQKSNDRLEELRGHRTLFDLDKRILENNLYGIDLNEEAIEICRLSLWIKTAERGKILTSLDHTIRVGNSIIADPAVHPKAFHWQAAFPEVFSPLLPGEGPGVRAVGPGARAVASAAKAARSRAGAAAGGRPISPRLPGEGPGVRAVGPGVRAAAGGFDVVVANPPYVRQELLTPIKPYLESAYRAYHGMADLYVYFYELGIRLLKPGGLLSYVVTNKWMKSGYAEPLRRFFDENAWIESVVDFGHAKQIFEEVDVFPSIIVARRPTDAPKPETARLCTIPREQLRIDDLSRQIEREGVDLPLSQLGADTWQLEPGGVNALFAKIKAKGIPLREFAGAKPYRGVVTGCNDAFLIDASTRETLITADPQCAEIIKPYLRGQDVDRWCADWSRLWMVFTRRGIDIEKYPAIRRYLDGYRKQLEPKPKDWQGSEWPGRKTGAYKWYEVQDPIE
jgi:type I restriction-modification system DNA methylase subunit